MFFLNKVKMGMGSGLIRTGPPQKLHRFAGPAMSGAAGLPTGQRQGVTGMGAVVPRGNGNSRIPQAGALQFGSQAMGARKRLVRT